VQNKAVEPLGPRPINDCLEKADGHALPAPIRLSEHIDDNGVPAFGDLVSFFRAWKRVWQNAAELNPSSAGDDVWLLLRDREPSDIFASSQEIAEAFTRFRAENPEGIW
jgi:hypothetical protein